MTFNNKVWLSENLMGTCTSYLKRLLEDLGNLCGCIAAGHRTSGDNYDVQQLIFLGERSLR